MPCLGDAVPCYAFVNKYAIFVCRYLPAGEIKPPADGRTSLDPGGSCHMGRAAGLHPRMAAVATAASACRKIYSNYTHVVARCTDPADGTFEDFEMKREMSAAPTWMVEAMRTQRRQKCSECSAPPVFKTEFAGRDLPHGPEVSYGIPFRWSASRLLAADARAAACGGNRHNTSEECSRLLRLENWTPERFMQRYMTGTMPELFAFGDAMTAPPPSIAEALRNASATFTDEDEDRFLWTGTGWVACSQRNTTCYGTLSKAEWTDRKTRGASCNRVFAEEVKKGNVNSTAVGLDICNLNNQTNTLCQRLREAQACASFYSFFCSSSLEKTLSTCSMAARILSLYSLGISYGEMYASAPCTQYASCMSEPPSFMCHVCDHLCVTLKYAGQGLRGQLHLRGGLRAAAFRLHAGYAHWMMLVALARAAG